MSPVLKQSLSDLPLINTDEGVGICLSRAFLLNIKFTL